MAGKNGPRAAAGLAADRDYEVGYGKPPKHGQFRKGQSGNPRGRKKGSRGLKKDLDEALKEKLTITVAGKQRKDTTQGLAMYALAVKAATGDLRAQKLLADLVLAIFGPEDRGSGKQRLSAQDEVLLGRLIGRAEDERQNGEAEGQPAGPDDADAGTETASEEENGNG